MGSSELRNKRHVVRHSKRLNSSTRLKGWRIPMAEMVKARINNSIIHSRITLDNNLWMDTMKKVNLWINPGRQVLRARPVRVKLSATRVREWCSSSLWLRALAPCNVKAPPTAITTSRLKPTRISSYLRRILKVINVDNSPNNKFLRRTFKHLEMSI